MYLYKKSHFDYLKMFFQKPYQVIGKELFVSLETGLSFHMDDDSWALRLSLLGFSVRILRQWSY